MLYHAAAPNLSDFPRIGLNHVFTTVMFRPQIDWKTAIKESKEMGWEKHKDLLGLDYSAPNSVEEYLQSRKVRN